MEDKNARELSPSTLSSLSGTNTHRRDTDLPNTKECLVHVSQCQWWNSKVHRKERVSLLIVLEYDIKKQKVIIV